MFFLSKQRLLVREHRLAQVDAVHKALEEPTLGAQHLPSEYVSNSKTYEKIFARAVQDSHNFFSHSTPKTFYSDGNSVIFESNVCTDIPQNNTVQFKYFPSSKKKRVAIVLPYWNALGERFDRISSMLALFGVSALRLSLPYHDYRRPHQCPIASHMVSSNLGRTIQSVRQAVLDVRCAIDWLVTKGYADITLVGFSIGSCIATITAAHDTRVRAIAQVLMASNFSEVVWTGIATEHIRRSLEGYLELEDLKRAWEVISPDTYVEHLFTNSTKILMLTARFDPVFLPILARDIEKRYRDHAVDYEWREFGCGHYTLGDFPYNLMSFASVVRWLRSERS